MMAKCTDCESALLRAKYCGDHPKSAWAYWFTHLMDQGWSTKKPGTISALSMVTLAEHISDNRCGLCHGTAGWMVGAKWQTCPSCHGSGVIYLSNRAIATRLGFSNEGLKAPWIERLSWARQELISWENRAVRRFFAGWQA
jgi:hypothetical protein